MRLLFVICSLVTIVVAQQEPSLTCRYYDYGTTYGCELTVNNPNGFNNFTEIGGIHLEGFTNADVNALYTNRGTTTNIPDIICETFPNLINLDLYGTGITTIDDNSFRGCPRITQLYLFYNRINSISENAFANNRDITRIYLDENFLTTLPENLFANQQNLTELSLSFNSFNDLPAGVFRPLTNVQYLYIGYANISNVNVQWFTENTRLNIVDLSGNRITLTTESILNAPELIYLSLSNNGISEIPRGAFSGVPNLQGLDLYRNNFRVLRADSFPDLNRLSSLELSFNPIETIEENAFRGLEGLSTLDMAQCGIRDLESIPFTTFNNLTTLNLNFNLIEDIAPGTFASMENLNYIGLWNNRLKTLRRNAFGSLTALRTMDLDGNIVNALERAIIDDAVNLNTLYFEGNLCASNWFGNFLVSRATYLPMLETCFRNMRYIVDTTTENDGIYSFFEGPSPGIVLRVRSESEVQIALTPFEFIWEPSVEIFIGATNNTRSVIRINEETNVVTVPTPNIIQQNQWNDFRVTWANQNVLVFIGNETYPFMSYTMQQFFPVNFYGLRAVETRATWSVQPIN